MEIIPKAYEEIKALINNGLHNCLKAIVSGSSKNKVEMIIDKILEK